jgi:hypothetical protein
MEAQEYFDLNLHRRKNQKPHQVRNESYHYRIKVAWGKQEIHTQFWLENRRRKRVVGRCRRRSKDNIKMDITERGCENVKWTKLAQDKE